LGWRDAIFNTREFVHTQTPITTSISPPLTPTSAILAYSLGNTYLVLALLSILAVFVSHEPRVVKWYLFIVAIGDVGHLYASYRGMGEEAFWDWNGYTNMMIGNIIFGVFLVSNRLLTLSGFFGRIGRFGK
jgi:hypothetical protein